MKIIKYVLFGLVVAVLAAPPLYHLFFRLSLPEYAGSLDINGLSAPVEVHTDEFGIPMFLRKTKRTCFSPRAT